MLLGMSACAPTRVSSEPPTSCAPQSTARVVGVVVDQRTEEPLPNALIVLTSSELDEQREASTDEHGRYDFAGLPSGTYEIQVLAGMSDTRQIVRLGAGATAYPGHSIDPKNEFFQCRLRVIPAPALNESLFSVVNETEARLLGMPKTRYGR